MLRDHQTRRLSTRRARQGRRTAVERLESRELLSNTFVVTNTNDAGTGTLRQAMNLANMTGQPAVIEFNIPGNGPVTIAVGSTTAGSALPTVKVPMTIDGWSEGVFQGTANYQGPPLVVIDGSALTGKQGFDFVSGTGGSVVQGLDIINFALNGFNGGNGIILEPGSDGDVIRGCYLGVAADGKTAAGNGTSGVFVSSNDNTIGGLTAAERNVISGNGQGGVEVVGPLITTASGNLVIGNYVGVAADGKTAVPNGNYGVGIGGALSTTVGGTTAGAANVISGNAFDGVLITGDGLGIVPSETTSFNVVQGNFIGTDSTGLQPVPNQGDGVDNLDADHTTVQGNTVGANASYGVVLIGSLTTNGSVRGNRIGLNGLGNGAGGVLITDGAADNTVGGTAAGAGNTIAANAGNGVTVGNGSANDASTTGNVIEQNVITGNTALSIDLGDDGVTDNDAPGHSGPNDYQNFPVLTSSTSAGGSTTVAGTFDEAAEPDTTLLIEFYTAQAADASGHGPASTFLGSAMVTTDGDGHASFSVPNLKAGGSAVPVGAVVSATATVLSSSAPGVSVGDTSELSAGVATTAPALQAVTVTANASNSNPAFGDPVTFTADVTPNLGTGTPTGTVAFMDGATTLDTENLGPGGQVSFTTSALTGGSHSIVAVYSGDNTFQNQSSDAVPVSVSLASATVTLSPSANPINQGDSVTFTAAVTGPGGLTPAPAGTVDFKDGGTTIDTETLGAGGQVTFTTTGLTEGTHTITAVYSGDVNYLGLTSDAVDEVVNPPTKGVPAVTLNASTSGADLGDAVTFTANVAPPAGDANVPTGTVAFMDGATTLDTEDLGPSGQVTFTTSSLAVGSHSVTAVYSGDANFLSETSDAAPVDVGQAAVTVDLSASAGSVAPGDPVTFTATVAGPPGAAPAPGGTVDFMDGGTTIDTETLGAGGQVSFTTSSLSDGSHSITAVYSGDTNYLGQTSAAVPVNVGVLATPTVQLTPSADTVAAGRALTFSATVAAPAGSATVPTGTVAFTEGTTTLDTEPLDAGGTASFSTSALPLGAHTVTAVYSGDSLYGGMSSPATTVTIVAPLQVTGVTPSANFLTSLPGNQIVVTLNRALSGLVADKPDGTGFASNPFAVMLIPSGPDGLATQKATGVYWSAPTGVDSGDLPLPATAVYHVNGDGTSTITLTLDQPLATDVYLITVNGLVDVYGDPLATDAAGDPGNVYSSFTFRPTPVDLTAPTVTGVTTLNGSVVINNTQIPQPDTIGIAFSKPMDTYTINGSTVQLFRQGVAGALPAAVAYSPSTQSAYLTPETALVPGAVYYVSVAGGPNGVTDDQGFPVPGVPLAQTSVTSFTVNASGVGMGSAPLSVVRTGPADGSLRSSPLGYGTVTFSEPLNANLAQSLLTRFSAMIVSQTGSAVRGAGEYADVPVNAKIAFNPNTNQLVIIPTGLLRNDTIYLFELSSVKAANGDALAGTAYATFLLNTGTAAHAAGRPSQAAPLVAAASVTAPAAAAPAPAAAHSARHRGVRPLSRPPQAAATGAVPAGPRRLFRVR